MKIASVLLSVYILILTTLSCVDSETPCNTHDEVCTISHSHNYAHGHGEEDNDSCSPFCVCNCCHTSVIVINVENFSSPTEILVNSIECFYQETTSEYFGAIWQPPKIS